MDVWRRILVPFALYWVVGEVKGVAAGDELVIGLADGLLEGEEVAEGLGDGVLEGEPNRPLWPKARNAAIATTATMITPIAIVIFLFFAFVSGLFLPHSGLT